jgi:outer membrane immunogenic protein
LPYFQGGAVWSKVKAEITGFGGGFCGFDGITCNFGTASKTRTGWTIGGCVEWRFAPQWSAFLEGNYYDFGNNNRSISGNCNFIFECERINFNSAFNTKTTAATVLVGVNWRPW